MLTPPYISQLSDEESVEDGRGGVEEEEEQLGQLIIPEVQDTTDLYSHEENSSPKETLPVVQKKSCDETTDTMQVSSELNSGLLHLSESSNSWVNVHHRSDDMKLDKSEEERSLVSSTSDCPNEDHDARPVELITICSDDSIPTHVDSIVNESLFISDKICDDNMEQKSQVDPDLCPSASPMELKGDEQKVTSPIKEYLQNHSSLLIVILVQFTMCIGLSVSLRSSMQKTDALLEELIDVKQENEKLTSIANERFSSTCNHDSNTIRGENILMPWKLHDTNPDDVLSVDNCWVTAHAHFGTCSVEKMNHVKETTFELYDDISSIVSDTWNRWYDWMDSVVLDSNSSDHFSFQDDFDTYFPASKEDNHSGGIQELEEAYKAVINSVGSLFNDVVGQKVPDYLWN